MIRQAKTETDLRLLRPMGDPPNFSRYMIAGGRPARTRRSHERHTPKTRISSTIGRIFLATALLFFVAKAEAQTPINGAGRLGTSPSSYCSGPLAYFRIGYAGKDKTDFELFKTFIAIGDSSVTFLNLTFSGANKIDKERGFGLKMEATEAKSHLGFGLGPEISGIGTPDLDAKMKLGGDFTLNFGKRKPSPIWYENSIGRKVSNFVATVYAAVSQNIRTNVAKLLGGADILIAERVTLSAKKEGSGPTQFGADIRVGGITPNFAADFNGSWNAGVGIGQSGGKTKILSVDHNSETKQTKVSFALHF